MGFRDIRFSCLIVASVGAVFALEVPYLLIDETRYLTVAWEMYLNRSFMVPTLNGQFYAHKPPLLFWLINLDWFVLGINEKTLRFIPMLFSFLNLRLIYLIGMRLWGDHRTAKYATLILASTLIYLLWSPLIMFDILLTFWILLGLLGLVSWAGNRGRAPWLLFGLSIAGGLLTKGPVIFVHLLPLGILYFLWVPDGGPPFGKWYLKISSAALLGIGIAFLWAGPAAVIGGDEYGEAILWGQTANRAVSSFAHQRPVWWYIPLLPILIFPWILVRPLWIGSSLLNRDRGSRFIAVWIVTSVVLFSLISGKQIYYLVPTIPGFCLLIARTIASGYTESGGSYRLHDPVGVVYLAIGSTLIALALSNLVEAVPFLISTVVFLGTGLIVLGVGVLFYRARSVGGSLKAIGASSTVAVILFLFAAGPIFASRYDGAAVARLLKEKQEDGYEIVNYGKYHGQYQFLGRLERPLVALVDKESVRDFVSPSPKVILVSYEDREEVIDETKVLYMQLYRGKRLVVWNEDGTREFLER